MKLEYLKLILTILLAVLGWIIAHWFTSKRDAKNKRREIRLTFLMKAYRNLENAGSRSMEEVAEFGKGFESAIADIQLFGTEEQVQMAKELVTKIASNDLEASTGKLLLNLRDELRKELGLKLIAKEPIHFRLRKK